jgi:hypothetical protein
MQRFRGSTDLNISENPPARHRRWQETFEDSFSEQNNSDDTQREKEDMVLYNTDEVLGPITSSPGTRFFWSNGPSQFLKIGYAEVEVDAFFGKFAELALFRENVQRGKPRVLRGIPFELVFGDPGTAAIYRVITPTAKGIAHKLPEAQNRGQSINNPSAKEKLDTFDSEENSFRSSTFSLGEVKEVLETKQIRPTALLDHLSAPTAGNVDHARVKSLRAFATIVKLYQDLPGASIVFNVTAEPLDLAKWLPPGMEDTRTRAEKESDSSVRNVDKSRILQSFHCEF